MASADTIQALELEIDLRLTALWRAMDAVEEWNLATAAGVMRAAYANGHRDALTSANPDSFYRDYGYAVPVRAA